jgi:hypothetical protein
MRTWWVSNSGLSITDPWLIRATDIETFNSSGPRFRRPSEAGQQTLRVESSFASAVSGIQTSPLELNPSVHRPLFNDMIHRSPFNQTVQCPSVNFVQCPVQSTISSAIANATHAACRTSIVSPAATSTVHTAAMQTAIATTTHSPTVMETNGQPSAQVITSYMLNGWYQCMGLQDPQSMVPTGCVAITCTDVSFFAG